MPGNCVVIGAGRFGLGFAVPLLTEAGLNPTILIGAREGQSDDSAGVERHLLEHQQYLLHFPTTQPGERALQPIRCNAMDRDQFDPDPSELLAIFVSIGTFMDSSTANYVQGLADRHLENGQDVVLVPFENRIGDNYHLFLESQIERGCQIVRSVVDRMCFERLLVDDFLYVSIERHKSWIARVPVADQKLNDSFNQLFPNRERLGISTVERIRPFHDRKARLVNGSHFAIALKMGCQQPDPQYQRTDEFVKHCPGISQMLERIHDAYIASLLVDHEGAFTEDELRDYATWLRRRLSTERDTPSRILRRLKEDDLSDWISSYFSRVHKPIVQYDRSLARELATELYEIIRERDLGGQLLFELLEGIQEDDFTE